MKTFNVMLTREQVTNFYRNVTIRVPDDCEAGDIERLGIKHLLDLCVDLDWEPGDSDGTLSDEIEVEDATQDEEPDIVLKWGRDGLEVDESDEGGGA